MLPHRALKSSDIGGSRGRVKQKARAEFLGSFTTNDIANEILLTAAVLAKHLEMWPMAVLWPEQYGS